MKLSKKPSLHKPKPPLKPFQIPEGFILVIDTREQNHLFQRPPKGLTITSDTLHVGDYSIKGYKDQFCIERKQMSDFYSFIGRERVATTEKLHKMSIMKWSGLVIEEDEQSILAGYMMSQVPPEVARQFLNSVRVRYHIHTYMSDKRARCMRWVLDSAIKFYRVQNEC